MEIKRKGKLLSERSTGLLAGQSFIIGAGELAGCLFAWSVSLFSLTVPIDVFH